MSPETTTASREVFVAYPWTLYSNRASYKRAFTKLQKALAVKFIFAEERISSGHVLEKIAEMIEQAAFGIYDVSGWNPNVTLEYGMARGLGAITFIAFNPDKTKIGDVPTDVRGYDRLQYTDFDELSEAVATLVRQQLGKEPVSDPLEDDRRRLLRMIRSTPGKTARELAEELGERLDYIQLLIRRSGSELETTGATRGVRYYIRGTRKSVRKRTTTKKASPRKRTSTKRTSRKKRASGKRAPPKKRTSESKVPAKSRTSKR